MLLAYTREGETMPSFRGWWQRLPLVVRASSIGLLVAAAGEAPWVVLARINVRLSPSIPWAVVVMGVWLFVYWKYLAGAGWPQTTRAARVRSFRSLRLTRRAWLGALGSGGLAAMSLIALELVVLRLVHIPAGQSAPGNAIPIHSLIPLAVMSAFASAIPEEVGFRGYMQAPLERGNHPVFAIGFVAIVFGLAHLSHGLSILLLFDFAFGLVYGVLAFYADSLLPGIILHCALDVVLFLCGRQIAAAMAGRPLHLNAWPDVWFWILSLLFVLFGAGAMYSLRKLAGIRPGRSHFENA